MSWKIYENLTYFPAIVTFGISFSLMLSLLLWQFRLEIQEFSWISLNMVKGKIARKLETIEKSLIKQPDWQLLMH